MAQRVYLHVGLPKTGTTYVQTVLWHNREALAEQGLVYPGVRRREHLWASMVVREHPGLERRNPRAKGAWARLLEQVQAAPDAALISHEFFGAASAEQAKRALTDLGDVEVHLIVTARDLVTVVTSYWQEYIKHGFDSPLDAFPPSEDRGDEWTWAALDLLGVLERWGASLPPGAGPPAGPSRARGAARDAGDAVRRPDGRRRDGPRRRRRQPQLLARRRRGRAPPPDRPAPRRLHQRPRPRGLDPQLPLPRRPRAAWPRVVPALVGTSRGAHRAGRRHGRGRR